MTNIRPLIPLTEYQHQVLDGLMLGDGSIQLDRKNRSLNARLVIRRAIKDKPYLLWSKSIFEEFCSANSIREYSDLDVRTNKIHKGISLTTLSNPSFTNYHNKWYGQIKRVPSDLELNSLSVLIWFLDDGCIVRTKSSKLELKLSTDGFSKEDNEFLQCLLSKRYGVQFNIYSSKEGTYHIRGCDAAAQAIINDILPIYPFDIMSRKATWLKPFEVKSKSRDLKRTKILEFLFDKDSFFLNDLGRFAGFTFMRKSRPSNLEVATSNVKYYLQSYIDNGFIVALGKTSDYHLGIEYKITKLGKIYFNERRQK